ncbi:MAG: hypothetical protein R2716_07300 [Microthrixaceae bacterium]
MTQLASGIARIAATWAPRPVILRMSDFKTNEYASLIGGGVRARRGEPDDRLAGASRYYHPDYREGLRSSARLSAGSATRWASPTSSS